VKDWPYHGQQQHIKGELAQIGNGEELLREQFLAQLLQPFGLAVRDIPVSTGLPAHLLLHHAA